MYDPKATILSYYQGAYGPTIRIDTQTIENLIAVKLVFDSLARYEPLREIELVDALGAQEDSLKGFFLSVAPEAERAGLFSLATGRDRQTFRWINPPEFWLRCSSLVEALIESNESGHQYLSSEGDDVNIEIAYAEERPQFQ
jgi:hypothetical protein